MVTVVEGGAMALRPMLAESLDGLTFAEALERWKAFKAPSWCRGRRWMIEMFSTAWRAVLGGMELGRVRPLDVQRVYLARDNGRAATTLNDERRTFKAFWSWAVDLELVDRSPVVPAAWPRKHGPRCRVYIWLTPEQEARLLEAFAGRPRLRQYPAIVRFAIRTGLRAGELRALVWGWIVPGEGGWMLAIPGRFRKSRAPLTVPLSAAALEAIGRRGAPGEKVFPRFPRNNTTLQTVMANAARRAGLPPHVVEHISMHQLRRTFAMRLRRSGLATREIAALGGWASEEVVDNHYTCALSETEARALLNRI